MTRGRDPRRPIARRRRVRLVLASVATLSGLAVYLVASRWQEPAPAVSARTVTSLGYSVVHAYPHDPNAFTQGLLYRDGALYESTGLNGRSSLRKVSLETGEILQQVSVSQEYFAEGLTDWNGTLLQLTWKDNLGFAYDLSTFTRLRTFRYSGEGWGLAHDARRLIMSDGSSTLRFMDPETLRETGHLPVTEDGHPVENLNELEVVKDQIFANIWQTDDIVVISPANGHVVARLNLLGLKASLKPSQAIDVLNGIAYDAGHDRLFVTGKLWPSVFEIRIGPK